MMMNNGTMQGMGVQRGGMMGSQQLQQQHNGMQRNGNGPSGVPSPIHKYITERFRTQQIPNGWQRTMMPAVRVHHILQLITQLRLMSPQLPVSEAADIAMNFELSQLTESPDQPTYEGRLKTKQNEITATRSRQAQSMQQQFQNSQGMMNMPQRMGMPNGMPNTRPGQFPPGFPNPQMPRQMHPSGMPMQQQGQQPGLVGPGMPQDHGQPPQAAQPGTQQQMGGMGNFTPDENHMINQLARHLATRASPADLEGIRARISAMPPAQRQALEQQKIDPLFFWFRKQAATHFMNQRKPRGGNSQPNQQGVMQAGSNPQRPGAATNLVNRGPHQGTMPGGLQSFDGPYGDNQQMNHIMDLQREGFKGQVDGRTVVPASQQPPGHQAAPRGPQSQPQFAQGQPPRPMSNAQASRGQQSGLTGQNGGLNGPMAQALAQHSPAMQTLNQPMAPSMQRPPSQNAPQPNQQPPKAAPTPAPSRSNLQDTPQLLQQFANGGSIAQSNMVQQRFLQSLPPAIQQKLLALPPERRVEALRQVMEKQRQQLQQRQQGMYRNGGMGGAPAQAQQIPQGQMMQNQQFQQRPLGQVPKMQGMPNGQGMPGQQNGPQGAFLSQGGNQQAMPQLVQGTPSNPPPPMNEEQVRQMDCQDYPTTILNSSMLMQHIPQDVKTWGDLKSWVSKNPHLIPSETLEKLRGLQRLHFGSLMQKHQQHRKIQEQMSGQPNQPVAPVAPMGSSNGNGVSGPKQPFSVGNQISAQELNMWRMNFPQLRGLPDEYAKQLIMRKKTEGGNQASARQQQSRAEIQANGPGSSSAPFPIAQSHPPAARPGPQMSQAGKPGPPQALNQQSLNSNQSSAPSASDAKGVKRPSSDDVVEVPNPAGEHARGLRPTANLTSVVQKANQAVDTSKPLQQTQTTQVAKASTIGQQTNDAAQPRRIPGDASAKARYMQIKDEVQRSFKPSGPVQMDVQTKTRLNQLLLKNAQMLQRTDPGIGRFFISIDSNEDTLRDLLRTRLAIMRQYRDGELTACVDNFTITGPECEKGLWKLHDVLKQLRELMSRSQQQQAAQNTMTSAAPAALPVASGPAPNRFADSTSRPPVRQLPVQKSHATNRDKEAPPAPTSPKPPFQFGGSPPPHGVPAYHGPNELTQDKLNLPKRRKANPTADGNAEMNKSQGGAGILSHNAKAVSPLVSRTEAAFKCAAPGCEYAKKGFSTADALAKHIDEVHREKDPEDPLLFVLDQAKLGLGLDSQGKLSTKRKGSEMERVVSSQPVKQSLSVQGLNALRMEGGTPMSRLPTSQAGSVGAMRTPQGTPSTKPATLEDRPTPQMTGHARVEAIRASSKEPLTPPDLWVDAGISPAELSNSFPAISDLQGCPSLNSLTPDSTVSGNKSEKNSPKAGSDVEEMDGIEINIESDSWFPASIFQEAMSTQYDNSFVNDDILNEDWETVFPPNPVVTNRPGKRQKLLADDDFAFDTNLFSLDLQARS